MVKNNTAKNKRPPRPLMRRPPPIKFLKLGKHKARHYEPTTVEPHSYGKKRELIKKQGYFFRSTNTEIFEKIKTSGRYFTYRDENNSAPTTCLTPSLEDAVADGIETSTVYGMKPLMLAIDARPYKNSAYPVTDIDNKKSTEIKILERISFNHIVVLDSLNKLEKIMSEAGLPFKPKGKAVKDFEKYYLV